MAQLKSLGRLTVTYGVASLYGIIIICLMLWRIIKVGWTSFSKQTARERPKVLDNPSLGTHGYVNLKEVRLHYVEKGSRDRPLMLFLHGFPEFWYSWRHQLREFSKDYRAVAVDLRGYSESDKPPGVSSYRARKFAEDVNQMVKTLGYDKCILVGHDWGGVFAYHVALLYPDVVDKLIIMNAPHPAARAKLNDSKKNSWSQWFRSWYMYFFQLPWLPELLLKVEDQGVLNYGFKAKPMGAMKGFNDTDMDAYKYNHSLPGCLTSSLNYYRALLRYQPSEFASLIVSPPTLIIWGTGDHFLLKPLAELSAQCCKDGTVRYLEDVSHWVQQEEPEHVNRIMRNFLNRKKT